MFSFGYCCATNMKHHCRSQVLLSVLSLFQVYNKKAPSAVIPASLQVAEGLAINAVCADDAWLSFSRALDQG